MHDCLHEAMDLDRWLVAVRPTSAPAASSFIGRDTREPSPFSHELLNANPYAFLDDAPLEERRTRAVTCARGLSIESASDLGRLDPEAIAQVRAEAWPLVRDADELHDALACACCAPTKRRSGRRSSTNWSLRDGAVFGLMFFGGTRGIRRSEVLGRFGTLAAGEIAVSGGDR